MITEAPRPREVLEQIRVPTFVPAREPFPGLTQSIVTEVFQTDQGDIITVLPTCEVPLDHLSPQNWDFDNMLQMGKTRSVLSVELTDGTHPGIIAKSPERVFTQHPTKLAKGDVWWGGKGEKGIRVGAGTHRAVEAQAVWEASILAELDRNGIRAEKPQAIITYPDGRNVVVVKEVPFVFPGTSRGPDYHSLISDARDLGFTPEDANCNFVIDPQGYMTIIDVNRWQWSPHTDTYRQDLIATVKTEIAQLH